MVQAKGATGMQGGEVAQSRPDTTQEPGNEGTLHAFRERIGWARDVPLPGAGQ